MIFLQVVETADLLTPLVALAGSLIGAATTLTVAMLRFGLGKATNNPGHGITKTDLENALRPLAQAIGDSAATIKGEVAGLRSEVSSVRGELGGYGQTLGRIEGKLHSHGTRK